MSSLSPEVEVGVFEGDWSLASWSSPIRLREVYFNPDTGGYRCQRKAKLCRKKGAEHAELLDEKEWVEVDEKSDEVYSRTLEGAKRSALSHEVCHSEGLGSERKWLTVSKLIE